MAYTDYENSKMLEMHKLCGANSAEASRQLKQKYDIEVSSTTLQRRWKAAGYKPNPLGGKRIALNKGREVNLESKLLNKSKSD